MNLAYACPSPNPSREGRGIEAITGSPARLRAGRVTGRVHALGVARQCDGEGGALAGLGLHVDAALVLFHDLAGQHQTNAGAAAALGCKKTLKNLCMPEDVILISDLNEIPKAELVNKYKNTEGIKRCRRQRHTSRLKHIRTKLKRIKLHPTALPRVRAVILIHYFSNCIHTANGVF